MTTSDRNDQQTVITQLRPDGDRLLGQLGAAEVEIVNTAENGWQLVLRPAPPMTQADPPQELTNA